MDVVAATELQLVARQRRVIRETWLLVLVDLLVVFACFAIGRATNWVIHGLTLEEAMFGWRSHYGNTRALIYLGLGIACLITFARLGHYVRRRPFWQELGDILAVVAVLAILDAALVFLTKSNFSRLWWATSWTLVAVMIPLVRCGVKHALMSQGAWRRPTVVVGIGANAIDAATAFESEPMLGFEVIGFIQPPAGAADPPAYFQVGRKRLPVLRAPQLPALLPAHLAGPHVVVALEIDEMAANAAYVERLNLCYGDVDLVSPMRGLPLVGTRVTHFHSHDVLALRLYNHLARPWPRRLKRAFDLVVGSLLLALLSPLFAALCWRVARGGWPVFYGHRRVGRGGAPFTCLKFRTMVPQAERVLAGHLAADPQARAEWQRHRKLRADPRITGIGAWLRRTSLDELPQLINVIRGEMSLVGPRPVVEAELSRYGDNLMYYLGNRPGLTGLWQVSGRNDVDYRRRVHLDCWYARNWSLWCDLVILIKTPRVVLRGLGAY